MNYNWSGSEVQTQYVLKKGGEAMPATYKKIAFTVTTEMEAPLKACKQELFQNCNRSEMLRELVLAGMRAREYERAAKENSCEGVP